MKIKNWYLLTQAEKAERIAELKKINSSINWENEANEIFPGTTAGLGQLKWEDIQKLNK